MVSLYKEKVPLCVVFSSIIASLVGLIFGYVGVFGVLKVEDVFYDLFVSDTFRKNPRDFDYCKYSGRGFQFPLYAGPLYLAGSLASLFAYPFITKHGPRKILLFSAYVLFIGTLANAFPYVNIAGLIVLGVGIGFGSQACLQYISEIAPARLRGNYTTDFHLSIAVGILAGNMIEKDYGEFGIQALIIGGGLPIIPALFLGFGAKFYLTETPRTLIGQDKGDEARKVLQKLRGTDDVDTEFRDITASCELAGETRRLNFRVAGNILSKKNVPQLVLAILVPAFQNLTGVLVIFVYAPLMFKSLGSEHSKYGLYSLAINGTTLVVSSLVCSVTVDRFGRKTLLICAGVLMTLCQVFIAIILGSNTSHNTDTVAISLTVLMGIFVMSYGLSWGPLGWSIPSELFTHETRAVGQSIAVSTNLVFTYIVLQFFIPLLCAFKYGLFLFFAGWIVVMTIFVYLLLPETKGVAIEEVGSLWTNHWFWRRYSTQTTMTAHETTMDRV